MMSRRTAPILRGTPRNLARLAAALQAGRLVAVPTETVYGLAADALNADACRRIFRAKRRPATDPLIVHLYSSSALPSVAVSNEAARALAKAFWPGPLTLVLPKCDVVPAVVTAGRDSVAVRVPAHPLFRKLLKQTGRPLAAPSANPFGYVSPTTARHVRDGLGARIDAILDGGESSVGLESTIVDVRNPKQPRLLRPGVITRVQLEAVLGCPVLAVQRAGNKERAQLAPGMLTKHYSPKKPVVLHETLGAPSAPSEAFVYFRQPSTARGRNVFWLDARGSLRGAARSLFAMLRKLDRSSFRRIHIELAPGDGLADAINDRLRRAAAQ